MRTHTHHISTLPAVPTLRGKRRALFSDTRHTNRHHGQYSQRSDVKQQLQRTTGESCEWVCCPCCPCLQEGLSASRRQPREGGCVSRWTGHADGQRAFFAAATADCRCCFRGTTPRITLFGKQPRRKSRSCYEAPQGQSCASWALECREAARGRKANA